MSDTTPLRCRDVRPYLSALPDGELTEPQRAAVALHVADCPACNALLERHREVKRLLAALPASEPSPEVFERVLAARSPQAVGPVARESLRRRSRPASANRPWRAPAFVTALLTPATPASAAPRGRGFLRATALPALAAGLVIALALLAFHRIPLQLASNGSPRPTDQRATGDPLAAAQAAIRDKARALGFQPVLPRYLPAGTSFESASLDTASSASAARRLDVSWALAGVPGIAEVRLRESALPSAAWSDIQSQTVPAGHDTPLAWQLPGGAPWRGVACLEDSPRWAVAQDRGTYAVVVDVAFRGAADPRGDAATTAATVLRLVSLSLDAAPRLSPLPAPPASAAIIHYSARGTVRGDDFSWDGYLDPADGRAHVTVTGAGGRVVYTDLVKGGAVLRLRPGASGGGIYRTLPASAAPGEASLDPGVAAFLGAASSYVQAGELWYVDQAEWNHRPADRYALTTAPFLTYVYVDRATRAVVAAQVLYDQPDRPGTAAASSRLSPRGACLAYSLVEYLAAPPAADTFSDTPPAGYATGDVPATIACGA